MIGAAKNMEMIQSLIDKLDKRRREGKRRDEKSEWSREKERERATRERERAGTGREGE